MTGWRLRFTREVPHPQEKVWRAITEPEHLAAWFPQRITGDWVTGGKLTFSSPEGQGLDFEGEILAFEPPSALEFTWGTDVIRLELEPSGSGCRITLLDTFGELGKAARDAAGWDECVDRLVRHLAGDPQLPPGQRWAEVHPGYVEAFGQEGATVGPPPGY